MDAEDEDDKLQRDTMRYWLLRKLRELREAHDFTQRDVSYHSGVDTGTISRFEEKGTWPRALDQIVAAYGLLSGIEDPRDIWVEAARNFKKNGAIPSAEDAGLKPAALAARLALEASLRSRPYVGESRGKPSTTRNRKAAG